MPLDRGSHLGPYEILVRLGAGGMGEVYRARDTRLGREVAIKVLTEGAGADRARLRRFVSEAKAASALNHPNILTVHEIGKAATGPYIVTELVDGHTVRELLANGPLPVSQALDIATQTAEGIAKAHEAGIVHRDIKPENLMVTRDGFVKILDFGLAKLLRPDSEAAEPAAPAASSVTATGIIVGTAGYLSPEQLRGAPADGRSDVFALGVVLYEMVTGGNPFHRGTAADTFSAILRDEPPPLVDCAPQAPGDLGEVVARALAKKPEDRFPGARAMAAELKRIRARIESGEAATAVMPESSAPRKGPAHRRWLLPAGALAAVAIAVVVALAMRRRNMMLPPVKLPAGVDLAVAVLPIQDESGDADLSRAKIGRILSDAFVQILSDVPKVYVVSPIRLEEVSRMLKRSVTEATTDTDLAMTLCRGSGANAMLTGRLSHVGKTYVLDAELTRLPDTLLGKFQASSEMPDRLLPELTGGIAEKIHSKIGASSTRDASQVATGSIAAYEHFVRGYDLQNEGEFQASIPELEKSVEIDPRMGLAWSFLACGYSFAGDDARALAAQRRAEQLLDTVNKKERRWIELNGTWVNSRNSSLFRQGAEQYIRDYPDDREGYFYAGLAAEWLENDCARALPYYEKAFRLTPTYYPIIKALVDCNVKLNRTNEAIAVLKRYLSFPVGASGRGRLQAEGRLAELQKGK
ncbi:MAG TPA: serine/threonine-protein kinase [Thermoanaerobaculia bacterium]|nr:serine/threonine-protein kinase [Thermoanaerobaculia bacterium]